MSRYRKSAAGKLSPDELVIFYNRMMSVVHETNEEWMKQRTSSINEIGRGAAAGAGPPLASNVTDRNKNS
jgi:hypothetical protein